MIFLKRRRLVVWIIKAYAKRLKKVIFLSFIVGLIVFAIVRFSAGFIVNFLPFVNKNTIGVSGAYTIDSLPAEIVSLASHGLTSVSVNGQVNPDVAKSWKIEEDGKKYTFFLKHDIYFSDDSNLVSENISYAFADVKKDMPDKYIITFTLKDKYSPFLVTVSKPIFKKGFVGVGKYMFGKIKTNGSFLESFELASKDRNTQNIKYQFYPTEDAVKTAFIIGEISTAKRLSSTKTGNLDLTKIKNVKTNKNINNEKLVTLFYNTQDNVLSDKRIRNALTYGLPGSFSFGERSSTPFILSSWANEDALNPYQTQDIDHAKILLKGTGVVNSKNKLVIKTLPQYEEAAKIISSEWKKLGVGSSIEIVESVPSSFQIFLGDFKVSRDPDQYPLWHSSQPSNISRYKNLRIDKLWEDGRKEQNTDERKRIYSEFQKYLLDDSPAAFLFFPYSYDLVRK